MIPLTNDTINKILPSPTLYNHSYGQFNEIENDIQLLLNWLDPCFPIPSFDPNSTTNRQTVPSTFNIVPSPRIKSAIRSCLKDNPSQLDFVKLYNNSISSNFREFMPSIFQNQGDDIQNFLGVVQNVYNIKAYYDQYLKCLNLNKLPLRLFQRHLNSLFYAYLIRDSDFTQLMDHYFRHSLFSINDKVELTNCISILSSIGLANEINTSIVSISIEKVKSYVLEVCSTIWDRPVVKLINEWVKSELYSYFSIIIDTNVHSTSSMPALSSDSYLQNLIKIAHNELVSLRIRQIFDIIKCFPSSKVALRELHQCISFTPTAIDSRSSTSLSSDPLDQLNIAFVSSQAHQREKLVNTFIEICHSKLLHSGVDTIDIVTFYSSAIKAFLIIDPKGVLLDKVARPIRRYLKTRSDVIPKLVIGLLDDNIETNKLIELAQELRKSSPYKRKFGQRKEVHDDDLNWVPDPIDALPDFKKGKVSDIIESIISIFDSKVVFVNEFTTLFGSKLLNLNDYNVEEIYNNLDLLKGRFGENEFTTLEIMIADILHSKKTNEEIYQTKNVDSLVYHPKILSHMYWSMLDKGNTGDEFRFPKPIEDQFQLYSRCYSESDYGRGRYLKVVPSLGIVKLELEIGGKNFYFEVSPAEASIVNLFASENEDDDVELTLESICQDLGMNAYSATKYIQMWVKKNVIIEVSKDTFKPNSSPDSIKSNSIFDREQLISAKNHKFTRMDSLWPLIMGMLTNLGPLPIEKIQSFLNITVPKDQLETYASSNVTLKEYLDWCEKEKRLGVQEGMYTLKK